MERAVGGGQRHRREGITFPDATHTQQALLRLLIGGARVPGHAHLSVVGADEIREHVEVVGDEIEYLLFDGRGFGGVRSAAGSVAGMRLSHGGEPLDPGAEQRLMPWRVPLEHAEQPERARQFVAEPTPLVDGVDAVMLVVLHGQAVSGALAMSSRFGRSSACMEP